MSSPSPDSTTVATGFAALGLPSPLLCALSEIGYESPSPIQAATIPPLLEGRDVLGTAQTGTGKTAAFALPILAKLDVTPGKPQALVLAPTRELAIQVAEAFQRYATHLPSFHVLPIYGGQGYGSQLGALKRGVHLVVGTPGRVIDHLERGSLDLTELKFVVLDEADEMLRMGFIDDVGKVLDASPKDAQVALFSATMPPPIRKIAQQHLNNPVEVAIKAATTTATNIRQRYWWVSGMHKLDAMTRILEAEAFDAMIVFARTKAATAELAEKLAARGFAAAAINGDMLQPQRERAIQQLREGKLDILVATDVAARGLDVDRISHVLNYDIPYDTESYVHRIGRTGRAGRSGDAILFVTPREKSMLRAIERATRQPIEEVRLPTVEAVNDRRIARFKQRINETLAAEGLEVFQQLIEQFEQEHNVPAIEIAAALARIAQGDRPLLMEASSTREQEHDRGRGSMGDERGARDRDARAPRQDRGERPRHGERPERGGARDERFGRAATPHPANEPGTRTYRIEVGHQHGVRPGNIVGAIASEAGLESRHIGKLSIRGEYSLIDLPEGMPAEVFTHLKKVWVSQRQLQISEWRGGDEPQDSGTQRPARRPRLPDDRGRPPKRGGFKPKQR